MMRLILLILVVFIAYQLIRKFLSPGNSTKQQPGQFEPMVSCSHCGLHLPRREAVQQGGKHYCSQEHALADQSDN